MLRLNTFDSGLLAAKVGTVDVSNIAGPLVENTLKAAVEQSLEDDYDLISVALPGEVSIDGWIPVGNLIRLEGAFPTVVEALSRFVGRCNVAEIRAGDRDEIASFLRICLAENRFTKDPNIVREAVIRQKMKILDKYLQDGAAGFVGRSEGAMTGFHLSYVDDSDGVVLYEIEIEPSARNGFLALDLIGSALKHLARTTPGLKRVSTHIYEDNLQSLNLFYRLGLRQAGERKCYYHCWPKKFVADQ